VRLINEQNKILIEIETIRGLIIQMSDTEIETLKQLEYLEKNAGILKKLYLHAFDSIDALQKETKECIFVIKEIRKLVDYDKIAVENIKPVISELKLLQKKISELLPDMNSINELFNVLKTVCYASRDLLIEHEYLSSLSVGFFGASNSISERQFTKGRFYVYNDENFNYLVNSVYHLVKLFERDGFTSVDKNQAYRSMIGTIQELVEVMLFLSKRVISHSMFFYQPKNFVKCTQLGIQIDDQLDLLEFAYALVKFFELISEAIEGLEELVIKYKSKPKKKILLEGWFKTQDGMKELDTLLKKTKTYIKRLEQ